MAHIPSIGLSYFHCLTESSNSKVVLLGSIFLFFFFVFLGTHLWHREVPRLGV